MINSKSNQIFRWQRVHLVLAVYALLISIGAFCTALSILRIPSEFANNTLMNFSLQRLVLIGGVSLVGILMVLVAAKAYQSQVWAEQVWSLIFGRKIITSGIRWGAMAGLLAGWIISFTPVYQFGDYQDYFVRLFPLVIFSLFASALTFVITWVEKYGLHTSLFWDTLRGQKKNLLVVMIVVAIFGLIWIFVLKTGMGIWVTDGFWYVTGVPILGLQIMLAFAIGIAIFFLEKSSLIDYHSKWIDLFAFFLLWGVAAFIWAREPLPPSYFAPGPYLPNFEYYPYSDAATFDIGSQFALIGQGINNGAFFDRALYMAFLVYLHVLAGQDYTQIVTIQAVVCAVFPAILYLLGKNIHSRSFGAILAVLTILRGVNGIAASNMIDLANQKQMLTDFPTVIFVSWFTLMIVKWLKAPGKNYLYTMWAGGVVGLAIMLRTNTLFLAVFAVFLIIIIYWRQKILGIIVGLLLMITMFAGTFAWGAYNGVSVFDVYMYRIRIVLDARYPQPATPVPDAPQGSETPPFISVNQNQKMASLHPLFGASTYFTYTPQSLVIGSRENTQDSPIFFFVATHFLHNVITSVLILPTSPVFHDLRNTVKQAAPFWQFYWDGTMSAEAVFFLIINLFLIALGMGMSWRFSKLSGLVPLGIFIFYNLANAFGRTSGGRYIVPMDWIVLLYFSLGLFQIILWSMRLFGLLDNDFAEKTVVNQDGPISASWSWVPLKKAPWIFLFFLFVGLSVPLSESFFSERYSVRSQTEQFDVLEREGYLQEIGFDKAELIAFSEQWPDFRIVSGRALYPRFFLENKGLPKSRYPYGILGFPRIAFTMIGPEGVNYVILPEEEVLYFLNASDVIVLGCQEGSNLDALAVVVVEDRAVVYTRQPISPLQCPLQVPVCDNNHVCR